MKIAQLNSLLFISLLLGTGTVRADAFDKDTCKDCPPPREICFNLFCNYQREGNEGYNKCQAASIFRKKVNADGSDILDRSERGGHPTFEVECDDHVIFNNSAHRYTDELGTRIQAATGPYPAVLLPKWALRDGHRYLPSALELNGQSLKGYCYVYTGPQLE